LYSAYEPTPTLIRACMCVTDSRHIMHVATVATA